MKKDKSPNKSYSVDSDGDDRYGKLNFKNYLRNLKEQDSVEDEFSDIKPLQVSALKKIVSGPDVQRIVTFEHGDTDSLVIAESDMGEILSLRRDENITLVDDCGNGWYVTRSSNDEIVFECRDSDSSGRMSYNEFVKCLK